MASFADGFGEAWVGLMRLAGCAVVFGCGGVVLAVVALVCLLLKS